MSSICACTFPAGNRCYRRRLKLLREKMSLLSLVQRQGPRTVLLSRGRQISRAIRARFHLLRFSVRTVCVPIYSCLDENLRKASTESASAIRLVMDSQTNH